MNKTLQFFYGYFVPLIYFITRPPIQKGLIILEAVPLASKRFTEKQPETIMGHLWGFPKKRAQTVQWLARYRRIFGYPLSFYNDMNGSSNIS